MGSIVMIDKVRPGDLITADLQNAIIDALNRAGLIRGAGTVRVYQRGGGLVIEGVGNGLRFISLGEDVSAREADADGHALVWDSDRFKVSADESTITTQTIEKVSEAYDTGVYLDNERVFCWEEPSSGKAVILNEPGPHYGKPTADIANGDTGTVTIWENATFQTSSITVTARNRLLPTVWQDAPIWIRFHRENLEWQIVKAFSATMLLVSCQGAVSSGSATFTVDGINALNGYFPDSTATVANTFSADYSDNQELVIVWNEEDDQWEVCGSPGGSNDGRVSTAATGWIISRTSSTTRRPTLMRLPPMEHRSRWTL